MRRLVMLFALIGLIPLFGTEAQESAARWWNDRVFYEIFVRSFYDSDGDGIGDLQGVIEKLDYLNDGDPATNTDLGVTGLWLMPVAESPSYHGYDVVDYRNIETDYGTNADFRQLIEEAHARGIAVIVDLVINHTSREHPWFTASARQTPSYADWYVWQDEQPTYRGPAGQPVWHPLRGRFYYGVFWDGMPDLNYENPAVTAEMYDIARYWLEDMGADGFRLDAIKHIIEDGSEQENTPATLAWMEGFHAHLDAVDPEALAVGEVWSNSYVASEYVGGAVDIVFEFDLAQAMVQSARQGDPAAFRTLQDRVLDQYPAGQYGRFLTNHDQNRLMTELRGDVEAAKLAASLLLTTPGVPFLYYGEEIGMVGQKPDERIRTPMQWDATANTAGFTTGRPWQPLAEGYETANVAAQTHDAESLLNHYRSLIQLRNAHAALRTGDFITVESANRDVYAFVRQETDGQVVLVILNFADETLTDYALDLESSALPVEVGAALLFGEGEVSVPVVNENGGFTGYTPLPQLPPRSTTILQLN